ncbi:MAG: hypothetical protein U0871_03450 [Gemmataceae bacterium]
MSLHLLIATAGLAGVLAAPVPEPTGAERLKWLYGIPSQAPNGGVIELTPCDKLRFLIPYYSGPDTAIAGWGANVTKSVVGDFVATVQVDESLPDYARALREGPVVSKLGFFLTPQSSVPFATEWSIDWKVETGVEQSSFVRTCSARLTRLLSRNDRCSVWSEVPRVKALRISRVGSWWRFDSCDHGRTWVTSGIRKHPFPTRVNLTLYASNISNAPYIVVFDKFTVVRPAAAKK